MDLITLIYTICVCASLFTLLLLRVIPFSKNLYQNPTVSFILRQVVYPYLYRRFPGISPITRLRAIFLTAYVALTIFCNLSGVGTTAEASTRAGWLSVINFIPLFISGRFAMATSLLGLSLKEVFAIHGATAVMVVAQTTTHIILELRKMSFRFQDPVHFYGFIAAVAMGTILISIPIRRSIFELFKKAHAALAILIAVAVWKHPRPDRTSKFYVLAAVASYTFLVVAQIVSVALRNFIIGRHGARAYVTLSGDTAKISLNISGIFRVKPGQFVYVCMPAVSFTSIFQSHPFMVSWQSVDKATRTSSLTLLAQVETGFTHKIKQQSTTAESYLAWIDGPYGNPPIFGDYESVVLVASGIGIAAHVLVIKDLIKGYKERNVTTKRVTLLWELEQEANQEWVKEWLTDVLAEDNGTFILNIGLFVLNPLDPHRSPDDKLWGTHERVRKYFYEGALVSQLAEKLQYGEGSVLVSVSAHAHVRDTTLGLVRNSLRFSDRVRFHVSDFQPSKRTRFWSWS